MASRSVLVITLLLFVIMLSIPSNGEAAPVKSVNKMRKIHTNVRIGESPKEIAEDLIDERGDGGEIEPDEEIEGVPGSTGGEREDP